jgi:ClpX C4-type zinc finger protein
MSAERQNRLREIIEHFARIAETAPPEKTNAQVVAEVAASGASNRDIALAFSTLVRGLQEHLKGSETHDGLVACSFCHKSQRDVKTMIQGPTAAICNECVSICQDTLSSRNGVLRRLFGRNP